MYSLTIPEVRNLQSKCWQGSAPSGERPCSFLSFSLQDNVSLPLLASKDHLHPLARSPFLIFKEQYSNLCSTVKWPILSLHFLPSSGEDLFWSLGLAQTIQDNLFITKSLTWSPRGGGLYVACHSHSLSFLSALVLNIVLCVLPPWLSRVLGTAGPDFQRECMGSSHHWSSKNALKSRLSAHKTQTDLHEVWLAFSFLEGWETRNTFGIVLLMHKRPTVTRGDSFFCSLTCRWQRRLASTGAIMCGGHLDISRKLSEHGTTLNLFLTRCPG